MGPPLRTSTPARNGWPRLFTQSPHFLNDKDERRALEYCPIVEPPAVSGEFRVRTRRQLLKRSEGRFLLITGAWAIFGIACVAGVHLQGAAPPAEEGQRIAKVVIHGNERVTAHRILGQMKLRDGSVYTPTAADEDLKRIYNLGEFDNVVLRPQAEAEGLVLLVEVTERPVLKALEFVGNRKYKDKDLQSVVGVAPGALIDRHKIFTAIHGIEEKYHESGYYFASVLLDEKQLAEAQTARYTITEGPRVRVRKIAFTGNHSISAAELQGKMTTKTWFPIFVSGAFDEDQLDHDVAAVRNHYVDQGFLDVRVQRELVFSADKTALTIRMVVEEGTRYRVQSVAITGVQRFSRSLLQKQLTLKPGTYYTADKARKDAELIHDTYGEIGYIDSSVQPVLDFAEEPGTADLTYKVDEGSPVRIGQVRIEGNRLTQDKVIRRELRFFPEEPVNTKLIDKARKHLEGLGLFKPDSINITTLPTGDPAVRDILVRVEETDTSNFILGAGISSNSGVLGNISLVNRNFDASDWPKSNEAFWRGESFRGAGQYLGLILEPGTELQRYRLDFREPRLWDSTWGFNSSTFFFTRDRDTYREQRVGEDFGFSKELWETVAVFANFRVEGIDIKSIDAGAPKDLLDVKGGSLLTSIEIGITKDTSDSYLMPTEGYRATTSVEQAGAMGGDYTFTKYHIDGRKYWTVTKDVLDRKSVLSVHGYVGFTGSDTPIFERFYAGGTGTIRGFKFRGVGPRSGKTELGGDFMALACAEYQFPIFEKTFNGVLFFDSGTVEKDITVKTWRASVGFGIRFIVPFFGPVPFSFDFGIPIAKDSQDKTQVFSFSIGTAF